MKKKMFGLVGVILLALMISPIVSHAEDLDAAQNEESATEGTIVMDEAAETAISHAGEIISVSAAEKSEEEIREYALRFMQGSQPEHDVRVLGMCPLYGLDDNLTGYYVLFLRDGEPNGYLLISFLHVGTPVVDLAFDGLGIFDDTQDVQMYTNTERVRYLGPDEFYVKNLSTNGTYISLFDNQVITETEAIQIYNKSLLNYQEKLQEIGAADVAAADIAAGGGIGGGIIDWTDTTLDGTTEYKIPGFGSGGSYWTTYDFDTHDQCSPTSLTNIMWYRGWQSTTNVNNIMRSKVPSGSTNAATASTMFWRLYTLLNTNLGDTGTEYARVPRGIQSFLGVAPQSGGVWNYREVKGFPVLFDTVAEQCPIHMHIERGEEGHAVFVLGRIRDTGGSKYLIVLDGWHRYGRLVVAGYYSDVKGYKIYITV